MLLVLVLYVFVCYVRRVKGFDPRIKFDLQSWVLTPVSLVLAASGSSHQPYFGSAGVWLVWYTQVQKLQLVVGFV